MREDRPSLGPQRMRGGGGAAHPRTLLTFRILAHDELSQLHKSLRPGSSAVLPPTRPLKCAVFPGSVGCASPGVPRPSKWIEQRAFWELGWESCFWAERVVSFFGAERRPRPFSSLESCFGRLASKPVGGGGRSARLKDRLAVFGAPWRSRQIPFIGASTNNSP